MDGEMSNIHLSVRLLFFKRLSSLLSLSVVVVSPALAAVLEIEFWLPGGSAGWWWRRTTTTKT